MTDIESRKIATLLHAGLVTTSLDGRRGPRVAQSWRKVDAQTWEFVLKRGLKFSNGEVATSTAVVSSLCASLQPGSLWAWSLSSIDHETKPNGKAVVCTGLSTLGSDRVRIRETRPAPWLFDALAGPGGWIIPAGPAGPFGMRPGLGPYSVASFKPDSEVTLVARQDGGAVEAAKALQVIFRFIPDPAVAAQAFKRGELDLLRIDTPQAYQALVVESAGGVRKLRVPGQLLGHAFSRIRVLIVNEPALAKRGLSPQQIAAFQQAYSAAIDREALVSVAPGHASPLRTVFPQGATGAVPPEDNFAVSAATVLRGQRLLILVNNDSYSDLLASKLPKRVLGADVSYRAVDFGVLINGLQKGEGDLIGVSLDATVDAPVFWASFFTPGAPFGLFGKPLSELRGIDLSDREGVARAAAIINAQSNWIPLMHEEGLLAASPRLRGLRLTKSGQENLENVALTP